MLQLTGRGRAFDQKQEAKGGSFFVFDGQRPEMGEGEALIVFQSIAKQVVEADMGKPDECAIKRKGDVCEDPVEREHERPNRGVRGIVDDSTHTWPAEIARK